MDDTLKALTPFNGRENVKPRVVIDRLKDFTSKSIYYLSLHDGNGHRLQVFEKVIKHLCFICVADLSSGV